MISIYFREQKRYTQKELKAAFHCSEDKIVNYIKLLKEYGILKAVRLESKQKDLTDLVDEDVLISNVEYDDNSHYYVFKFVGVICVEGIILKIYPKYISKTNEPKNEIKQIIKVLQKYNSEEQIIKIFNDAKDYESFNLLAILLYFIQDYYENGSYINEQVILEENGSGEIFWDKTINEAFTLISDGKPYYPTLYTKKRIQDNYDFFKRLHECIVTHCSKELEDSELIDLFDLTKIIVSEEEMDDFGDKEYILSKIENEINIQYNTRKQNLLKMMYLYISRQGKLTDANYLSMFGTTSFNLVWEKVCAKVLDNQLNMRLKDLPLKYGLDEKYKTNEYTDLLSVIDRPKWIGNREDGTVFIEESDTFIPDTVTIKNNILYIYDAKYYCIQFKERHLSGQPGIDSITKQYMYQLAYMEFVKRNGIDGVQNYFIIPTEEEEIQKTGVVQLEVMAALELVDIQILLLPSYHIYDHYINGQIFKNIF